MRFPIAPQHLVGCLARQRHLLLELVRRDVAGRYQGSMLGLAWLALMPLLMLVVYVFVFGVVFAVRRGQEPGNIAEFALSLFCGLLIHGLFSESLSRAPGTVVGQPSYVKKIVFPLEILPLVPVGSALVHYLAGLAVLLVFAAVSGASITAQALLLPGVLLPLLLLSAGTAWFVASLAVYLRDIGQMTNLLATLLLFLSPVFYSASAVPEAMRALILINPLTIPIEAARDLLLRAHTPNWSVLAVYTAASALFAWAGFAWFQKTRRGFADVL